MLHHALSPTQAGLGTAIAGASEEGVSELRDVLLRQGGRGEARTLVHGDLLPAANAAMLNGTMARALDYCDVMDAGLHLGSVVVTTALAAADMRGGCSGSEFLTAIVIGLEVGAHLNLTENLYRGFDPTGIAGLMGATAAVSRMLELSPSQTHHALALAFNRCAGSFQSNADASLAVRLIQGFSAFNAIQCVELAEAGLTGPKNFLSGRFGYAQLFGRGKVDADTLVEGLGERWDISGTLFKKYPCCGLAQGPTETALQLAAEYDLNHEDIDSIDIQLRDHPRAMIGKPFRVGENPQVDAQFSAQYCVANAIIRRSSKLMHFTPESVRELEDHPLIGRISVHSSSELTSHAGSTLIVKMKDGRTVHRTLEMPPGYSLNELTPEEQVQGYWDCIDYSGGVISKDQASELEIATRTLEEYPDVCELIELTLARDMSVASP